MCVCMRLFVMSVSLVALSISNAIACYFLLGYQLWQTKKGLSSSLWSSSRIRSVLICVQLYVFLNYGLQLHLMYEWVCVCMSTATLCHIFQVLAEVLHSSLLISSLLAMSHFWHVAYCKVFCILLWNFPLALHTLRIRKVKERVSGREEY